MRGAVNLHLCNLDEGEITLLRDIEGGIVVEQVGGERRTVVETGGVVHRTVPRNTGTLLTAIARGVVTDGPGVDACGGGNGGSSEIRYILVDDSWSRSRIAGKNGVDGGVVKVVGVEGAFYPPFNIIGTVGVVGATGKRHGAGREEVDGVVGAAVSGDGEVLDWTIVDAIEYSDRCGTTVSIGAITGIADSHLDGNSCRGTAIVGHRRDKLNRSEVDGKDRNFIGTEAGVGSMAGGAEDIVGHFSHWDTNVTQQGAERTEVDE